MFADLYMEALLTDERAADDVWELWHAGLIDDDLAVMAWRLVPELVTTSGEMPTETASNAGWLVRELAERILEAVPS